MKPWKLKLWRHEDLAQALESEKKYADAIKGVHVGNAKALAEIASVFNVSSTDGRSRQAMRIETESENQQCREYKMRVGTINGGPPPLGLDMILAGIGMPCMQDVFMRSSGLALCSEDKLWVKPYWPEVRRGLEMSINRLKKKSGEGPFAVTMITDTFNVPYADREVKSANDALEFLKTTPSYIPQTAKVLAVIPGSAPYDKQYVHCTYIVWDVPVLPYLAVLTLAIETCEYVQSQVDTENYTISIG